MEKLSPREIEMIKLSAEGLEPKVIAHKMGINVRTIEAHKRKVRLKLGARNWLHAVVIVIRNNMLGEEKVIRLISFGYKHGSPPAGAHVFDCRDLTNPHHIASLREQNGLDEKVQDFVRRDARFDVLLGKITPHLVAGKTIAFGCVGGKHRSVAMAEIVGELLIRRGFEVEVEHRQLQQARRITA